MKDLTKKAKKLRKKRRIALTLIIMITIILLVVLGVNVYTNIYNKDKSESKTVSSTENAKSNNTAKKNTTEITKKTTEEVKDDNINILDESKCTVINPAVDGNKYTIKNISGKCAIVTLNDNFKLLYDSTYEKYYLNVNGSYVKKETNFDNIVFYVTDNMIITENEQKTCGYNNYIYISKDASFGEFSLREGMCLKGESNLENNKFIINATSNCGCDSKIDNGKKVNPNWYIDKDKYFMILSSKTGTTKSLSFDELLEKYNITRDYAVELKYTFDLNNISSPIIETTKTIRQLYDDLGPSAGFYSEE